MENVVIIGSGCAGWTAALYTARANLKPLVITGEQPGGLLTTTSIVENFPGFPEGVDGYELMTRMQQQAERFGTRVKLGSLVQAVDFSKRPFVLTVDGERVETQTVIIATGASHRHLGLESEDRLEKKGVTYCATCDGALPMFRNQPLVVVGGGDSACEEATFLTRFASVVYLIHRRDSLRASKIMAERTLANPKIKLVWDSAVTEVFDVKQEKVTGVRVKQLKTNAEQVIDCAGLFGSRISPGDHGGRYGVRGRHRGGAIARGGECVSLLENSPPALAEQNLSATLLSKVKVRFSNPENSSTNAALERTLAP